MKLLKYPFIFPAILTGIIAHSLPEVAPLDANQNKADTPQPNALENNKIKFAVNVKDIAKDGKCFVLSDIVLSTVSWKISTCRIGSTKADGTGKSVLQVSLDPIFASPTTLLSFETKGNINLEHKDGKDPIKQSIDYTFNSEKQSNAIEIGEIEELKETHSKDGQFTFEIDISISSLKRKSAIKQVTTKFYVNVPNVSTNGTFSPEVVVADIKWKISTKKKNDGLAIYLYAVDEGMDVEASWKAEYTFKLLSWDPNVKSVEHTDEHTFNWRSLNYGFGQFIKWEELIDKEKQYSKDGAARFLVELTVTPET